jgi:hypothetical protein
MLIVGRTAAATLSHEEGQVVGIIGERMRRLSSQGGRTSEDRCPDLGQRDPKARPRATSTVRVLSSGIAPDLALSLEAAHGMLDRRYHLPRREDGAFDLGSWLSSLPAVLARQ